MTELGGEAKITKDDVMKMFLDSAKIDEIRYALEMWDIDGVTTNPRHVANAGKPLPRVLEEIAKVFEGTDKPVSVEVNPHLSECAPIVDEALRLSAMSKNFVIKVGASEAGFRAIRELSDQGVRTNATLIFSPTQAWLAARSGAFFVSPFVGWKETHGEDTTAFISEVAAILDNWGYSSQIIAAAIRNSRQIADAAIAGAHCVTAGLAVYKDCFRNPFTDMGNAVFTESWDATPK